MKRISALTTRRAINKRDQKTHTDGGEVSGTYALLSLSFSRIFVLYEFSPLAFAAAQEKTHLS